MVEEPEKDEATSKEVIIRNTSGAPLTIFTAINQPEVQEAIRSLISGRTPKHAILQRQGPGGKMIDYINTYYSTHQIGLITGFRWSSECLEEKGFPDIDRLITTFEAQEWPADIKEKVIDIIKRAFLVNPREVGAHMKVTIYDAEGNPYSHQSWGQKDVGRYSSSGKGHVMGQIISIFDDFKAATSDGIKKCLSYFGIGADVYGAKDLEFYERGQEDNTE